MSRTSPTDRVPRGRFGAWDILVLSAWCGLSAGWLEVATRLACRAIDPTGRLFDMSRHFVWLTPLANLLVFLGLGSCLAAIAWLWPRMGGWLGPRLLVALVLLPALMVAGPGIFAEAWLVLAMGIASQLAPRLEREPTASRRWLLRSLPGLAVAVGAVAGSVALGDWLEARREAGRALPPAGSPNVLLIVLDTVRADRLSLYGYPRPTTPTLERLAQRGIRFERARATAPWTLASHASFFSGRWPHELGVEWHTPLRPGPPMLAEYLGTRGYATAGFVANVQYCSSETGLARGFTHYEDYRLEGLTPLRTSIMIEEALRTSLIVGHRQDEGPLRLLHDVLKRWFRFGMRRDAASINRGFLDWLARRRDPRRPFFAFLNYLDAHAPYELPEGARRWFGRASLTRDEVRVLEYWTLIDKSKLPRHYQALARDAYDSGLSYLDERLGGLFGELRERGVLDRTWVVIVGDHGEGLGEHDLFEHGESLYSTEIHVPLLIVPPSGLRRPVGVVGETVSLRDLPATVADLAGLGAGAPFAGASLARLWKDPSPSPSTASRAAAVDGEAALSELPSPNPSDPNQGRSPAWKGPLVALAEGDFVYIRNEADGTEQLFDERDDPRELTNRAGDDSLGPILGRFRQQFARIKGGRAEAAR